MENTVHYVPLIRPRKVKYKMFKIIKLHEINLKCTCAASIIDENCVRPLASYYVYKSKNGVKFNSHIRPIFLCGVKFY